MDKSEKNEIVEMRLQGKTYRRISKETGISKEIVQDMCSKDPRVQSNDVKVLRGNMVRNELVKIMQNLELTQGGHGPKGLQIAVQIVGDKAIEEALKRGDSGVDSLDSIDIMRVLLERVPEPRLDNVIALAVAAVSEGTETWKEAGRVLGLTFRQMRHLKQKDSLRGLIENLIGRSCVNSTYSSRPPKDSSNIRDDFSIKEANKETEIRLIEEALNETGGNRSYAAALLEISHRCLLYKMKEYGIGGEPRPSSRRLNEEAVKVIKWFLTYRPEVSKMVLAKAHGVSPATIGYVSKGMYWSRVEI